MYGVWIRRKPGTRLPEEKWLHQALTAAYDAEIERTDDAVEAFRRTLADVAQ
jgi:hypothetical protein